jgi:hypothetical protein
MSSRRTKPQPLSDTEIRQITADLAAGRPPMVWFTSEAVGVPEGRSGKVLALGDPAEGDFLQVRPTGSKDVLSFSPTEVTLTKPARRTAPAAKPRKDTTVSMPSAVSSTVTSSSSAIPSSAIPSSAAPSPLPQSTGSEGSADPDGSREAAAKSAPAKQSPRPAKAAAPARKAKAVEVTVTLSGTADGEWTVDVVNGKKRTVRGLSVAGSAVAQAAKLLHPEVAEVVDSVLDSVRSSQRAKVEQLQAELEQARRMLDELSG